MEPKPPQPKLLRQWVTERIRADILEGRLKAGEWLRQEQLAQRYEVSQMPVREALKQLISEGLVRHEVRRGARVVSVTRQDVSDLYACRALVEGMAASLGGGERDRRAARRDAEGPRPDEEPPRAGGTSPSTASSTAASTRSSPRPPRTAPSSPTRSARSGRRSRACSGATSRRPRRLPSRDEARTTSPSTRRSSPPSRRANRKRPRGPSARTSRRRAASSSRSSKSPASLERARCLRPGPPPDSPYTPRPPPQGRRGRLTP